MSNKVKDISIKNHTHYFFSDISNIKRLTNKLARKGLQKKNSYSLHRIYDVFILQNKLFQKFFLKYKYSVVFHHHN